MARKTDRESRTVARRLAVLLLAFYASYYLLAVILTAAFQSPWRGVTGVATYPFEHDNELFNPSKGGAALGRWLAMVLTYLAALAVNYFYIKTTRLTWDYACSASLLHLALTCAVTTSFPLNWIWWLTIVLLTAALWLAGDYTVYKFVDLRDIELNNT
mmetsp:Transcript_45309/g.115979  ORF Transcript_45309/g.115979 Transcript_45309/m.115979 type:complete len:158 (+) Transcript_45309:261-734(+)|eukprot:jgi/Tetstr1/454572/TSEL_041467.t1